MNEEMILLEDRVGELNEFSSKYTKPGCLGSLRGPIASWKSPTRNNTVYGKEIWTKVFSLAWVKEALETLTLFGHADHPDDGKVESKLMLAAVVLTDYEINDKDQCVYGSFDILDTPSGRIVKALAVYGCVLGVSSRGKGKVDKKGKDLIVDPDYYIFGGFDVVANPSVQIARMQSDLHESQNLDIKSMNDYITSQINESNSIDELSIIKGLLSDDSFKGVVEQIDDKISQLSSNNPDSNTIIAGLTADLKRAYDQISDLSVKLSQVSTQSNTIGIDAEEVSKLKSDLDLANKIIAEYEKSSSSDTNTDANKEDLEDAIKDREELIDELATAQENLEKSKEALKQMTAKYNAALETSGYTDSATVDKITELTNEVTKSHQMYAELESQSKRIIKDTVRQHNELVDQLKSVQVEKEELQQEFDDLQSDHEELQDSIEGLKNEKSELESSVAQLQSELEETQSALENAESEVDSVTEDYNSLVDQYNAALEENAKLMESYISAQASKLGTTSQSLTLMLPEGYSLEDVNSVVKDQLSMKKKLSKLSITAPAQPASETVRVKSKSSEGDGLSSARTILKNMS